MKGLILIADGFEDIETLGTIDIIRRSKIINLETVSVMDKLQVNSQSNIPIRCEKLSTEIKLEEYRFIILPGGRAISEQHLNNQRTFEILKYCFNNQYLIGAICAAPLVLDKYNFLDGRKYTCFPSIAHQIKGGIYQKQNVVVDQNIITSKAAGTTFDFAYEIIKILANEELAQDVINNMYYCK